MSSALVWRPRITGSDATLRRIWENQGDLRDVSEEMSLTNLPGDVSEICKSALFEMSLRRCMRRLKNASEMHRCWLGVDLGFPLQNCIHFLEYSGLHLLTTVYKKKLRGIFVYLFISKVTTTKVNFSFYK